MNKQAADGIEYVDYTWNPIAGCQHGCRWRMPDGNVARCYAETMAQSAARQACPHGFRYHYWNPDRLDAPLRMRTPARIFLDSMGDLMGAWVPDDQINAVLSVVRHASWHIFLLLAKNAPRLLAFRDSFPPNLWLGVSSPPTFMLDRLLSTATQQRMLAKALSVLRLLKGLGAGRWMSFEPLSLDAAPIVKQQNCPIEWAVIGAASRGATTYQPQPEHVQGLLDVLDDHGVPVFFKGNLKWSPSRHEIPDRRSVPIEMVQGRLWD